MKRKVIQIADSTQLISIPRPWGKKYNIKKGDELEIVEKGPKLEISTPGNVDVKIEHLDISDLGVMLIRWIHALYKRGVDEIHITYDDEKLIEEVYKALRQETIGYEIINQEKGKCTIKYVTGELGDFDPILRRTFLVLMNMAAQTVETLEKRNFSALNNISLLEETNNRFTTICRRLLNKRGYNMDNSVGALYYIIEDLENIADYYKYLCVYFYKNSTEKTKFSKEALELLKKTNIALKLFYEVYYKFDKNKIVEIGDLRKDITIQGLEILAKKQGDDVVLVHHIMVIVQKIFCLIGPLLVMHI